MDEVPTQVEELLVFAGPLCVAIVRLALDAVGYGWGGVGRWVGGWVGGVVTNQPVLRAKLRERSSTCTVLCSCQWGNLVQINCRGFTCGWVGWVGEWVGGGIWMSWKGRLVRLGAFLPGSAVWVEVQERETRQQERPFIQPIHPPTHLPGA